MNYFLDAAFAIDYLRNDPAAIDRFDRLFTAGDDLFVNEVVICELATGMGDDDPVVTAFLRALEFVQPGRESALAAGRWRAEARRRGRTLSLSDALIAAAADSVGATLLTRNVRDFALTPVLVETY